MTYENMVSLRLSDADRALLDMAADESGLSRSQYLRALLRMSEDTADERTVYVVDGKSMAKLALELTRWGRHYNQAVRAMNTIAMLVRRGSPPEAAELRRQLDGIDLKLAEVEQGRRDVEYALIAIADGITVGGE